MTRLRHRLCITEVEMVLICAGTKSNSSSPPRPYGVRVLSRAPVPVQCVFWDLNSARLAARYRNWSPPSRVQTPRWSWQLGKLAERQFRLGGNDSPSVHEGLPVR